jgi:hypothetical protein
MLLVAATLGSASAQDDWRAELSEEWVEMRDGKMVIEEFILFKVAVPGYEETTFQVRTYSEAPATGLISRDVFVGLSTIVTYEVLYSAFAEAYDVPAQVYLQSVTTETLDSPIGKPDLELNLYASDGGMQVEVVNTGLGQSKRFTATWKDMLGQ